MLEIDTGEDAHLIRVEVARTPDERSRGLMFRQAMPADAGMLFDFGSERPVAMWMKNTFIPLDMLFATEDGKIVSIARDTVPLSTETISSGRPVRYVLELGAGRADALGLSRGDTLRLLEPTAKR